MRSYAVYEHPDFEISQKESEMSRAAIYKVAATLTALVAASLAVYQLVVNGKSLPTAYVCFPTPLLTVI